MFGFREKEQKPCGCGQKSAVELEKNNQENLHNESDSQTVFSESSNACLSELATVKEQYVRLVADFQNYKKRMEKDRFDAIDKSKAEVLQGILAIVDNFDRALDEARHTTNDQVKEWLVGFELIHKILYDFLKEQHVELVTQNEQFDPTVHEAIAQVEVEGKTSGQIVDVFEKGFLYKGKVLRTAKVTVAK